VRSVLSFHGRLSRQATEHVHATYHWSEEEHALAAPTTLNFDMPNPAYKSDRAVCTALAPAMR
jgi:hypothetical protein